MFILRDEIAASGFALLATTNAMFLYFFTVTRLIAPTQFTSGFLAAENAEEDKYMLLAKAKTEKAETAEPELGNEFRASARYDASRTESVDPEDGFLTKRKERRVKISSVNISANLCKSQRLCG